MITEEQRNEFTRVVGTRYTKRVRDYLAKKKIVSEKGIPYSDSTIRHVFIGTFSNKAIEDAFFQLCQEAKNTHLKPRVF